MELANSKLLFIYPFKFLCTHIHNFYAVQASLGSAHGSKEDNDKGKKGIGSVDLQLNGINLFVGGKELIKDAEVGVIYYPSINVFLYL